MLLAAIFGVSVAIAMSRVLKNILKSHFEDLNKKDRFEILFRLVNDPKYNEPKFKEQAILEEREKGDALNNVDEERQAFLFSIQKFLSLNNNVQKPIVYWLFYKVRVFVITNKQNMLQMRNVFP